MDNVHKGHRERVREAYLRNGLDSFEDHQLLEFLLFYCYPMKDTNEIAHRLLNEYGSLHNLFEADALDISRRCNVSKNVGVFISMIPSLSKRYFLSRWGKKILLDSSKAAGKFAIDLFVGRTVECFYILCLNTQRGLIHAEKLIDGTVAEAPIYSRDVVATALKYQAASVILTHNHPGGGLVPSQNDIDTTKLIVRALEPIRVNVVDHIIVAGHEYYSFMQKRIMPFSDKS